MVLLFANRRADNRQLRSDGVTKVSGSVNGRVVAHLVAHAQVCVTVARVRVARVRVALLRASDLNDWSNTRKQSKDSLNPKPSTVNRNKKYQRAVVVGLLDEVFYGIDVPTNSSQVHSCVSIFVATMSRAYVRIIEREKEGKRVREPHIQRESCSAQGSETQRARRRHAHT